MLQIEDDSLQKQIEKTIEELSSPKSYNLVYHEPNHGSPMPSVVDLHQFMKLLREVLFPGYFGNSMLKEETIKYYTGVNIDNLLCILTEQVKRGLCFQCSNRERYWNCSKCDVEAQKLAAEFISKLPEIRHKLSTDVEAAYNGDPAAKSIGEIIFCYPCIIALTNYRVAHEMIKIGVPLIPRILSEMAHSETGIDIHPEAEIGEYFTIDHGTGVVIGATSIIGKNVQIYQGVTLGAKSFPLDEDGNPIKGVPRHPIVEDNVVIYSNASILGRITIGKGSMIGGNVWVTNSVAPNSKLLQRSPKETFFIDGAGI